MSYHYSAFISYRRNAGDEGFIKKFTAIIECEALKVTNIPKVFLDENTINWGEDFDDRIYDGIVSCYFFIPFYHNTYLHENNIWCAKELYRAIAVERKIRNIVASEYCFILPIIDRGAASAFPECIGRKNAKEIKRYRHLVINKKTNAALEEFKENIYEIFLNNYRLLGENTISELCADITVPTDDEIIDWIREQKEIERKVEANRPPILRKSVN